MRRPVGVRSPACRAGPDGSGRAFGVPRLCLSGRGACYPSAPGRAIPAVAPSAARSYNPHVTRKQLLGNALNLSIAERARLAREIIASLDGPAEENAAGSWVGEIERRVREVHQGHVKLIGWAEVRKRIEARLAAGK